MSTLDLFLSCNRRDSVEAKLFVIRFQELGFQSDWAGEAKVPYSVGVFRNPMVCKSPIGDSAVHALIADKPVRLKGGG
jgi:hypothetical protein